MKKYKVSLTFIETVEAEDEEDAKLIANMVERIDEQKDKD